MAKTIDHLTVQVGVTPYEHEGCSFDALHVSVGYQKGTGFYVSWTPVKLTQYGYQTGMLPSKDPLVGGGRFIVERVQKNNSKRLTEMHAALELAQEGIALYFDKRLWMQMENLMRYVCLYGFTEHYRQEVENLKAAAAVAPVMRQYNDLKKKKPDALLLFRCGDFYEAYEQDANDVVKILGTALSKSRDAGNAYDMVGFPHYALDAYLPKLVRAGKRVAICDQINENTNKTLEEKEMKTNENNESKNVAMEAQVNNASSSESRAESHSSYAESQEGSAKANNVTTEADVAEVNDIMPKVTKRAVAQAMVQAANGGPATTMPLGKHGTLVIAGVGGTKKEEPKANSQKPEAKVQDSVPATGKLTYATYEKQKTNKTTGKPYTVTHAKIMGFAATDEAYQRGMELHGAVSGEMVDGVKVLGLYFSHRYAAAAKDVCDALNEGRPFADCVAIIDNATEENAKKREEWKAKIEERKQKRDERKARKSEDGKVKSEESATAQPAMDAKEQAMFELFKKFMAGDKSAMEQVGTTMMAKAA